MALERDQTAATPRLTAASRQYLAKTIALTAEILLAAMFVDFNTGKISIVEYPQPVVDAMKPTSPEVQQLTNVFVDMLESGLSAQ